VGNRTDGDGGALYCTEWPYLANCIFWDNADKTGSGELAHVYHWGGPLPFNYCCIQGWTGTQSSGPGNIGDDPMFTRAGYWDSNGTTADPNDDFWMDGDYHLKSQVGRWDPIAKAWVQDGVTSPCIDAGDPASPIMFELFPNGGVVNMGAYGGTAEASKSYFGTEPCKTIVAGDINGDCVVNMVDLSIMCIHWLEDGGLPK
jgi:hypothetical protein